MKDLDRLAIVDFKNGPVPTAANIPSVNGGE
jgi:hypothetical protein